MKIETLPNVRLFTVLADGAHGIYALPLAAERIRSYQKAGYEVGFLFQFDNDIDWEILEAATDSREAALEVAANYYESPEGALDWALDAVLTARVKIDGVWFDVVTSEGGGDVMLESTEKIPLLFAADFVLKHDEFLYSEEGQHDYMEE